jgi:hypothetical protein
MLLREVNMDISKPQSRDLVDASSVVMNGELHGHAIAPRNSSPESVTHFRENLDTCDAMLDSSIEALTLNEQTSAVEVLGVKAGNTYVLSVPCSNPMRSFCFSSDPSVLTSVVGTLAGFISFVLQKVFLS